MKTFNEVAVYRDPPAGEEIVHPRTPAVYTFEECEELMQSEALR